MLLILLVKILFVFNGVRAVRKQSHPGIAPEHNSNDTAHPDIDAFAARFFKEPPPDPQTDFESDNYFNNTDDLFNSKLAPKEKRRRLLTELGYALVPDKNEVKLAILADPEHPYINATTGQCFNHVITTFSRACIVSTAFGGWRMIKGFFAVACKALELKRQRIAECINRVCKKYPYLKI